MEKDIDHKCVNSRKGITLGDALGYRVCDTIVAANALTLSSKFKLKDACKKHYADHIASNDLDNSNLNMISFLTDKANTYLQGINKSQVTKSGRVKDVDMILLASITNKANGNNSTVKNITYRYNKCMKSIPVSRSTIYLRLKRRLDYSYRKIRVRNSKVKKAKYRMEVLLYYLRYMDALRKGDLLIWMDESSFNDRNAEVKSWQKKHCQTRMHYDKGRIKSVSVMSALTLKDCILTHYNTSTNNSEAFIRFVKELIERLSHDETTKDLYINGRCHLILDNARIHRSDISSEYIRSTCLRITYLPTYSPMINNVELYWNKLKAHTRKYVYNDT